MSRYTRTASHGVYTTSAYRGVREVFTGKLDQGTYMGSVIENGRGVWIAQGVRSSGAVYETVVGTLADAADKVVELTRRTVEEWAELDRIENERNKAVADSLRERIEYQARGLSDTRLKMYRETITDLTDASEAIWAEVVEAELTRRAQAELEAQEALAAEVEEGMEAAYSLAETREAEREADEVEMARLAATADELEGRGVECEACGAEYGEPCGPLCIGQAADADRQAELEPYLEAIQAAASALAEEAGVPVELLSGPTSAEEMARLQTPRLVTKWGHVQLNRPMPLVRRDSLAVGDVVVSSHSGQRKVERVEVRGRKGQTTYLWLEGVSYPEAYSSDLTLPLVERASVRA